MGKRKRYLLVAFLVCGIVGWLFFSTMLRAATEPEKRVLFISSYSESFITVPEQIEGLSKVFKKNSIAYDIEYMDAKRFSDSDNINVFYNVLKYKLQHIPTYDGILVGDDNALEFVIKHQKELFSGIPIIFFGVNDNDRAVRAEKLSSITGSLEETSLVENIRLAEELCPTRKNVFVIVDQTLTGQGDQKQFLAAKEYFPELDWKVLNSSQYSYEKLGKVIEDIPSNAMIIFLSMNQDNSGRYLDLNKQINFLKEHGKVPIFRASVGGVGSGLLGGKMIDYRRMGENAANMLLEIFKGRSVNSYILDKQTPYYYFFDYALVKKYHLDESKLPETAVYVNKEVSAFEQYHKYFVAVAVVSGFMVLLILVLFVDNIRNRQIQRELTRTYNRLADSEENLKIQCERIREHSNEVSDLYQKYDIAIQSTNSAVWEYDLTEKTIEISDNFVTILGHKVNAKEEIFTLLAEFLAPEYSEHVLYEMQRYLQGEVEEIHIQVPAVNANGEKTWVLIKGKGIRDVNDEITHIYGIFLDITTLKEQEEYIEYFASHDYLTFLPNRMRFMERLSGELRNEGEGAVLLLDIDNFKSINDTIGHMYGDELLKQIAARLNLICDSHMFVARLGGDEFLVLLLNISAIDEIEGYAQKIKNSFSQVFSLDGHDMYVNFSMGITRYPDDSDNINQLIMNADTAMYKVKHNGKNNWVYFREDMQNEVREKMEIEIILRQALVKEGFYLLYQPQIQVATGEIVGFEALLRLKSSHISPALFIPVAEETGQIIEMGRWVAEEAIAQLERMRYEGHEEKIMSINFSSKQLRDTGYLEFLKGLVERYKIEPKWIEIEITESSLVENDSQTIEFLEELKSAGFKIALDDFGTGYSSLNYLTYIPVDKIKLDKSINDKYLDFENTEVMESLISLAHSLNITITAEGIEQWDQFEKMKDCHCDYIQGYLFSKPLKREEMEAVYDMNLVERVLVREGINEA